MEKEVTTQTTGIELLSSPGLLVVGYADDAYASKILPSQDLVWLQAWYDFEWILFIIRTIYIELLLENMLNLNLALKKTHQTMNPFMI